MKPRSISIVQRNLATGAEASAELCWRYLVLISDWCRDQGLPTPATAPSPAAVLDAMLWGAEIVTTEYAYRIEH